MSKVKILEISVNDIELIKPLWISLNNTHFENSNSWKDHFDQLSFSRRVEKIKSETNSTLFTAQINNVLVGYCIVSSKDDVGEIDSIFIEEKYRQSGLGNSLMSRAEKWFDEKGIDEVKVKVAEGNESVFPFYEQCGYKKYMTILKRVKRVP